MKTILFGAFNV